MSKYSPPLYESTSPPGKHYPTAHSMSSAFSASANANEDWTKISDLAERRRIQNRIAQRNYRKKLKKRLEDLERRAGSSSASPEQQPAELVISTDVSRRHRPSRSLEESSSRHHAQYDQQRQHDLQDLSAQQIFVPLDDSSMFSQQATRQLSTSPPPFTYAIANQDGTTYAYAQNGYCIPQSRQPIYNHFMQPSQQAFPMNMSCLSGVPIKAEPGEDDMSPFSMSYASIANLDVSMAQSNHDVTPYTPSLLDPLDFTHPDSPPESLLCPRTPTLFPQSGPSYI